MPSCQGQPRTLSFVTGTRKREFKGDNTYIEHIPRKTIKYKAEDDIDPTIVKKCKTLLEAKMYIKGECG